MTVCIAAICEGSIVLGASDRMITSGDIKFEPPSAKVLGLTSSIALMFSGDAALHSEVAQAVRAQVNEHIKAFPLIWLTVREVADMIVAQRNAVKLRQAEAAVLQPLGLTAKAFLQGAHGLGADLTKAIATDLVQYPLPSTEWIVCGNDDAGAHIYVVQDGRSYCQDQIGFAAIGSGGRHAESQFMLSEHSRQQSLAETLLLLYSAKKRAEVAPGVGQATDMFTVGPDVGTLSPVHDAVLDHVNEEYARIREGEAQALALAQLGMQVYVAELLQAQQSEQTTDGIIFDDEPDDESVEPRAPDASGSSDGEPVV